MSTQLRSRGAARDTATAPEPAPGGEIRSAGTADAPASGAAPTTAVRRIPRPAWREVMRSARASLAAVGDRIRPLAAPVAGAIVRRVGVVSALGWWVVLAALIAAVVGVAFGWAELVAVAIVGALLFVVAIPFVLVRPSYDVRVELASPRVVVGERAIGRLVVRNAAARPSPATRIELPVGAARPEFRMPRLAPAAEHDDLFTIPTQRRAVLTVGPVTSVRSDPAGMLRRTVAWTDPTLLYVHPRTVALSSETTGILRDLEGLPTRDLADDDVSFHALREYAPGDDLRHVHWRSTARTQTLMIRQYEQTRRSHLVVALSTHLDDYADADEFELAVSVTGSIGVAALREGKALSVVTGLGLLAAPTTSSFLDGLSALATSAKGGLDPAARQLLVTAPSASVVVFVTGQAAPLSHLRSASLRVPTSIRAMGVRAATASPIARRAIGDLVFADVPTLDTLPRALRAVSA